MFTLLAAVVSVNAVAALMIRMPQPEDAAMAPCQT
jgi:hypothetical protein